MQLWRKRHEKGPDTNVRWVVGNLKVKGTKDCILRLQFLGGNSRLIKLDKSDLCFFSSQPANLKIGNIEHMFEKLLLLIWPFSSHPIAEKVKARVELL